MSKTNGTIELEMLEHFVREYSEQTRTACNGGAARPLKLVVDNYPEGQVEEMEAVNNPEEDANAGTRKVPFSRVLYIEQDDFRARSAQAVPSPVARPRSSPALRLPGDLHQRSERRQRQSKCEMHCTYDPATRGGNSPDGRKVKSTIHWVSAARCT